MAAPVNANINVLVNTQQAMAQLRALQGQVATLNKSLSATSGAAAAQQAALAKGLRDSANASRMWQARIVPMNTSVNQFSEALDRGRMSLGQYARYAGSQLPGMRRVFRREFDMMTRAAEQNVRRMQTQYTALGNSAMGAAQAMAFTPTALNKQAAATAIAAQRQMMMNRMIDLGTTKLLNWGKNTQWAGRQLMVGFSIPLAMVGAVAAKAFKEIDKGSIAFKRVYGDLSTTTEEMEKNLEAVKTLGNEYTKYGIKLAATIELAADVAATGAKNNDLMAATEQTLRLATLGLMEHQEALEATIALQTAFGVSSDELGSTIDFLNVVENETILTMQDMAAAIPRVAPVVKGLGGDVKDLAVFMTAMREGGVTAEQGANALKSGLGRLINPTKAAREVMASFGMSIDQIVMSNKGDLMGIIQSFGDALSRLGDFEQQQVLEKVFGKYQYARLGALFKNLANDASQAQRTIELTNMSVQDLATISERELGKIEEATSTKFAASVEKMKVAIAPIGETFMKALMPIINTVTDLLNKFNNMPDNIKNAIAIAIGAIAGLGPIILMTIGLIANGIANIGKFIQLLRKFFARLKGDASLFNYLTREEQEATAAAQGLAGATDTLTTKFVGQQRALERLIQLVGTYAQALRSSAAAAPIGMGVLPVGRGGAATARGGAAPRGRGYNDGVVGVPGVGNKDTVPAMLTPGESVVTKEATQKYAPVIAAMNAGTLPGLARGVTNLGGIPVPAPMAGYNIKSSSILPVQGLIESVRQVDGGLDAVTAVLREFAQTGRLISKKALQTALQERGISLARSPMYSQAQGNVVDRSHVLGLGVERTSGLLQNLNAALQSSDPIIRGHAQRMLQSTKVVELYKSGQDILAREVTETAQVLNALQQGTMALTAGFKGTVMGTPQAINNLYNQMPRNIRGDTLSLQTFNQQVRWAEQEFRELAQRLNITTAELADDAVINNMVDEAEKQRINALRLLIAEGQETAQLQMTEQEFMRNRLKQMGLALQAERGQTSATIANAEAEAFATQQMQLLRQAGVFATDATIDYAKAMQILAASAIGQAGGMVVAGQNVPQQVAKRAAQRRTAKGYAPVANMRSIPTSTIPTPNPAFTAATQAVNANRFIPLANQQGIALGTAMGTGMVQGSVESTRNLVPTTLRMMGQNSPHPLMAKAGTENGTSYGRNWVAALNKILMTAKVIPPMPAGPSSPIASGRILDNKSFKELSGMLRQDLALARKELGNAFRQIPAFAHESLRNIKPIFSRLTKVFLELNPWITQLSYTFMGLKLMGGDLLKKARSAYETVMLQTMLAWDKVKALPAKARSAYETAMLRTMMAWDSVKRIPAQITNRVSTFMSDLPRTLQRLKNQVFYRGQDIKGRVAERVGAIRDRFATGAQIAMNPVPRALAIATAGMVAQEKFNGALARASAVLDPVRQKISQFGSALTLGAQRISTAVQFMMDPLARAVAMDLARQKIMQQFNRGVAAISSRLQPLRDGFNSLIASVRNTATKISRFSQLMMDPLGRAVVISTMSRKLQDAFSNAVASVRAGANKLYESLLWGSIRAITGIENATAAIKTGITNTFNTAMQSVRAGATKIYESFLWGSIQVVSGIEKTFSTIRTTTAAKWNQILVALNTANIRGAMTDAWKGIRGAATQGATNIKQSLLNAGTAIRNAGSVAARMIGMTAAGAGGVAKGIGGFLGTVNEKTGRTRAQSIGTASNSAVMGLMGLSMAASFAGGEVGEMAQKIMPVTMGLLGLQMILPMLKTPFGLAIVAVAALAAVFVKTRRDLDNFAKEAADAGANLGGFANRLKVITDATGYQFAGARAQERLFRFTDVEKEAVSQFSDYFEGEGGQKFLKDLRELTNEDRYNEVAKMISFAIADGMDEKTAKEYGYSIAYYLGDALMKQRLESDFAANRFAGGIDRIIEIIEQRQTKLDELLSRFEPRNVGQSGASRGLARATGIGEFDTQKSMFAEGVGKMGAIAGLGAVGGLGAGALISTGTMFGSTLAVPGLGTAAVGTRIGAMIGGITGPIGMAIGALAGTAIGAIIAWKQYQKQVAELNENVGMGAMILGNSVQTLGEVRNAEALLIEQYRQGLISRQKYIDEMERLNNIERSAERGIGAVVDSMIMGGQMDTGALMQAMQDQFVLAGFEGDLAKAITGVVNPETVGKTIFPENTMDEIMADVSKRNVVATVIAETLAGITPENAQQKIADVQNLWAGMADDLVDAAVDGLTLDEMRAIAAGKTAGETIFNALMSGAEEGMAGGGISPADTSPEGYRAAAEAAKAAAEGRAIPEGATVSTQTDGTQRVEIDGTTYTLSEKDLADMVRPTIPKGAYMEGRSEESYKKEAQNIIDRILDDTDFSEENIEKLQNILEKTGMSAEDFFAQAFAENQQFREDFEAARKAGTITDEQLTEMGFGETEAEIQSAIDAAIAKADIIIDLSDLGFTVVGAEQTARVIADDWAEIVEGMGEDSTGTQLQIGLDAASRALGEETMAELAAASQIPEGVRDPGMITGEDLVNLINKLSDEKFSGVNLQDAIAEIFATDAESLDEAFAIYEDKYGGLSEIFGDETQKVIDYLKSLRGESKLTAEEIGEIGSVVKGLPDDIAGRLGIDKQDVSTYAMIDPEQLALLQEFWSIYSNLPPEIDILANLEFLTTSGINGELVEPEDASKKVKELEKLYKQIGKSENIDVKKKAMVEYAVDESVEGEKERYEEAWENLVNDLGPEKVLDMGTDKLKKRLDLEVQIDLDEEALAEAESILASLQKLPSSPMQSAAIENYRRIIAEIQGRIRAAKVSLESQEFGGDDKDGDTGSSGSGSSGGEKTFVQTLKEGLLEQIQMWSSATATAADLNNIKDSFVKEVLRGQGLFNKLMGIRGLSAEQMQQIIEGGPEGMNEFIKKYTERGQISKQGQRLLDVQTITGSIQMRRESRMERQQQRQQIQAANLLRGRGVSQQAIENIAGDPEKAAKVVELQGMVARGVDGAEKELNKFIEGQEKQVRLAKDAAKAMGDPIQQALEEQAQTMERVNAYFEKEYALIAENLEQQFEQEYGMSSAQMDLVIAQKEDEIDTYRESIQTINDEIRALEKRNGVAADRSDWGTEQIQKEIDANNDLIRSYERQNEIAQRAIDVIKRQDEMRNRVSEALSHDLEQMSQAEEDIRETYEKRVEALDKVAEINDYIVNQQKEQLDLSRAISEGDIYAASRAAQQMRGQSAQFATEQLRSGLEAGVEAEVSALRTAGGLTREQAEQQIANIKEQSYQTSLQIRVLEDEIYNRQINQILPLKDKEYNLNLAMERITDQIAIKQASIKSIEEEKIQPIERQIAAYRKGLSDLALQTQVAQANVKYEGLRKDQWDRINNLIVSGLNWQRQLGNDTLDAAANAKILADQWEDVGNQINRARLARDQQIGEANRKALEEGKRKATDATYEGDGFDLEAALALIDEDYAELVESILSSAPGFSFNSGGSVGGSVYGQGSRDIVPAMLTPGEFVIRKAMVDKYGIPLMNALNQGAFDMPRYSVGEEMGVQVASVNNNMVSNINAPVYNTYDMKFSINGTNQSADEIANKVMFKMKQVQSQNVRSNRGY